MMLVPVLAVFAWMVTLTSVPYGVVMGGCDRLTRDAPRVFSVCLNDIENVPLPHSDPRDLPTACHFPTAKTAEIAPDFAAYPRRPGNGTAIAVPCDESTISFESESPVVLTPHDIGMSLVATSARVDRSTFVCEWRLFVDKQARALARNRRSSET
jgi:hypothetical protein